MLNSNDSIIIIVELNFRIFIGGFWVWILISFSIFFMQLYGYTTFFGYFIRGYLRFFWGFYDRRVGCLGVAILQEKLKECLYYFLLCVGIFEFPFFVFIRNFARIFFSFLILILSTENLIGITFIRIFLISYRFINIYVEFRLFDHF